MLNVGYEYQIELRDADRDSTRAILAAFNCISSMLMLTFFQKSKVWSITFKICSSMLVVGRQSAPLMAAAITAKSV